ncbi:hypothetical protein ACJRO7_000423 [Eucalyptus globulus]|uniref:Uncharacterized protein n=1 Tax=Eucalyptus globulus TaxID=34317 RepID=A0ABD3LMK1_EUCGL
MESSRGIAGQQQRSARERWLRGETSGGSRRGERREGGLRVAGGATVATGAAEAGRRKRRGWGAEQKQRRRRSGLAPSASSPFWRRER